MRASRLENRRHAGCVHGTQQRAAWDGIEQRQTVYALRAIESELQGDQCAARVEPLTTERTLALPLVQLDSAGSVTGCAVDEGSCRMASGIVTVVLSKPVMRGDSAVIEAATLANSMHGCTHAIA